MTLVKNELEYEVLLILIQEFKNIVSDADLFKESYGNGRLSTEQREECAKSIRKAYRMLVVQQEKPGCNGRMKSRIRLNT